MNNEEASCDDAVYPFALKESPNRSIWLVVFIIILVCFRHVLSIIMLKRFRLCNRNGKTNSQSIVCDCELSKFSK